MKKKLSVAKQVLNLLNTKGGFTPKQIIIETKAKPASVYAALNLLRGKKMIAKDEDGVYISQTQTSVSNVSNRNLQKENLQLTEWTVMWKRKCEVLERDYTQAKVMYLNSQAVVAYLEEKVEQLIKG
jgi:hypothetical protein